MGRSKTGKQAAEIRMQDPSAMDTILSHFPEQHTAHLHAAKLPLNPSQACFPLCAIDVLR